MSTGRPCESAVRIALIGQVTPLMRTPSSATSTVSPPTAATTLTIGSTPPAQVD